MLLSQIKPDIDGGKTAKLVFSSQHKRGPTIVVRIVYKEGKYIWQRGRIDDFPTFFAKPNTVFCEEWDELLSVIHGMQTETFHWALCSEDLD